MHRSAWKFLYGILSDRWSFSGDTIFFSFFLEILIFFVHNVIERGRATRTCLITTSLQQKHWHAARKPGGKLWPAVNDWRTHFALFILQIIHISFNIHNSSENTNNFVTSNKLYSTTECNIQIILLWQHYFLPSHLYVSVIGNTVFQLGIGSIICVAQSPPGTDSLAKGRKSGLSRVLLMKHTNSLNGYYNYCLAFMILSTRTVIVA